jgi:nitroreductase
MSSFLSLEDPMTNIDDLRELATNRRSIRGYDKARDVPGEVVRQILDCAGWAPSDRNDREFQKFVMTASRRGNYEKMAWVEDDTNR